MAGPRTTSPNYFNLDVSSNAAARLPTLVDLGFMPKEHVPRCIFNLLRRGGRPQLLLPRSDRSWVTPLKRFELANYSRTVFHMERSHHRRPGNLPAFRSSERARDGQHEYQNIQWIEVIYFVQRFSFAYSVEASRLSTKEPFELRLVPLRTT